MDNEAKEFGLFIDGLRLERNISREDLCDNVLSLSQYKRYLKGDASIPNDKLVLLADKLKFSINDFYLLFRKKHDDEYNYINAIYILIKSGKISEAYEKAKEYSNTIIVSEYNKLFYEFCFITIQYELKFVSTIHVLELFSSLINYPKCVKNESFNKVEISILIQICSISAKMGNIEPSNILYRILSSPNFHYSSADDQKFLPSIYATLSRILGSSKQYTKLLDISNTGIQYCLFHESLNALPHLYFFNALANLNLDNRDDALLSAKKCFMLLFIEEKAEIYNSFKDLFEKEFDMPLDDLIKL